MMVVVGVLSGVGVLAAIWFWAVNEDMKRDAPKPVFPRDLSGPSWRR